MELQHFLRTQFTKCVPPAPESISRTKYDVTLTWGPPGGAFAFLNETDLLYKVQKKGKIPQWTTVYSGGKITKTIDNLASSQAHVFRLQVLIKTTSVPHLSTKAIAYYGSEQAVYEQFDSNKIKDQQEEETNRKEKDESLAIDPEETNKGSFEEPVGDSEVDLSIEMVKAESLPEDGSGDHASVVGRKGGEQTVNRGWLESSWSETCWCSTEPQGASVACFSMAVRCGYIKQVQQMLDERPELLEIINSVNGLTPLITAIHKGDLNSVKFLLNAGADVNQPAAAGHNPLQMALLAAHLDVAALLLERGADITSRDRNGLRAEHYAADSGRVDVVHWIMERGGELEVRDNHGWTPLFRAVSQGASYELVSELLRLGADVTTMDNAGLTLPDVGRLLKDRRGGPRDSIVRLVDPRYPHERALDHFTRLTKKIYSVQTVFK